MSGGTTSPIVMPGDSDDESYMPFPDLWARNCESCCETTPLITTESPPVVVELKSHL